MDAQHGTKVELQALVDQLAHMSKSYDAASPDTAARLAIMSVAKQIVAEVSDPADMSSYHSVQMTEIIAIRTLIALKVFEKIPPQGSISLDELAKATGAQASLIQRLCRICVGTHFLTQNEKGEYGHTKFSLGYTSLPGMFFSLLHDTMLQTMVGFYEYLEKKGPHEPTDFLSNPYSVRFNQEGKTTWEIMAQNPAKFITFQKGMSAQDAMSPVLGLYDFSVLATEDDRPSLVDVGGGQGQSLLAIMKAHPELKPHTLILQDLPEVIALVEQSGTLPQEVKKMSIDFFKEQPVQHAKAYYLRRVLHDYADDNCIKILTPIAKAMAPDSRVLIADTLLPAIATEADLPAAVMDVTMLLMGGKERTEEGFKLILEESGLELVKIHTVPFSPAVVVEGKLKGH